jgi:hypothetical protein
MDKLTLLFEEFLMKAIIQSEALISADLNMDNGRLETFTENRDRLIAIINQISAQIDWSLVSSDKRDDLSRQLDFIKKLDEKILVKLQEYREDLRKDIEQTHRQAESIKGYNLNDVK